MGRSLAQESGEGDVIVVRYADDLVFGFQHRTEAERFLQEFRVRLAKFGLELHADKTRLIEFGRFAARDRKQRGDGKPETFTFLDFTDYCGQRNSNGAFIVWRITPKKRMAAKLEAIKAELQRRKHHRTTELGAWLRKVVLGYFRSMLFRVTRHSCAFLAVASAGCGEPCSSAAVNVRRWDGIDSILS